MNARINGIAVIILSILAAIAMFMGGWLADAGHITRNQAFIAPTILVVVATVVLCIGLFEGADHE